MQIIRLTVTPWFHPSTGYAWPVNCGGHPLSGSTIYVSQKFIINSIFLKRQFPMQVPLTNVPARDDENIALRLFERNAEARQAKKSLRIIHYWPSEQGFYNAITSRRLPATSLLIQLLSPI